MSEQSEAPPFCLECAWRFLSYLRVSLEVILEKRLLVPRLRVCDRGVASWDRVGEAGGPLYVAVRRSLSWPPWKVLRLAVPRGKRSRSGVVALAMLWIDATGFLWLLGDTATLLRWRKKRGKREDVGAICVRLIAVTRRSHKFNTAAVCESYMDL